MEPVARGYVGKRHSVFVDNREVDLRAGHIIHACRNGISEHNPVDIDRTLHIAVKREEEGGNGILPAFLSAHVVNEHGVIAVG